MSSVSIAEEWRPVVGYEGIYEVSSLGGVRSIARVRAWGKCTRTIAGVVLRARKNSCGYCNVLLCDGKGGNRSFRVHRLVAHAFCRNPNCAPQVNHIDGNKLNNRAENLEWVTQSQNMRHAFSVGLHLGTRGDRHGQSKLCEQDVLAIRRASGLTLKELGRRYQVDAGTIFKIRNRITWRHLGGENAKGAPPTPDQ